MRLYYKGHTGQIDFEDGPLAPQKPETLTKNGWSYETISSTSGLQRIRAFYREVWKASLEVTVTADSADEYNSIMETMHKIFEHDIRTMQPGKLYWGEYYREVYAVETSQSDFDEMLEAVTKKITFVSLTPFWVREQRIDCSGVAATGPDLNNLNLKALNLGASENHKTVTIDGISSCDFSIRFFGPVFDPYVYIGDHLYSVSGYAATDEVIKIDSVSKTVVKYNRFNSEDIIENLFYARNRDSYIFEKIPANESLTVRWPTSMENIIRIIVLDERGEPVWI